MQLNYIKNEAKCVELPEVKMTDSQISHKHPATPQAHDNSATLNNRKKLNAGIRYPSGVITRTREVPTNIKLRGVFGGFHAKSSTLRDHTRRKEGGWRLASDKAGIQDEGGTSKGGEAFSRYVVHIRSVNQ